ncbi:prepilin-type N-terminal cleavage/methylation domain-containing protein [Pelagicoccus sp. NFK12]|uniref:Prepilin-type N-terminal cleavage/methylation domain-containing protein n=1 Tax=Pelagicoccus enzymogenes TaxID=2773457 RepID=A0A927IJ04_9BACT|nr:prepilin-type N-terminal cleavage/methylation domain-containing protein [Pelagicoccus enzymogenes]MBD5781801.1 prepilin-type N-terminal cleavage/methylation domain-containing protein [Pelagicoccus enzymogenes]MDQ8196557.1 prepilin-type N-terminal cleavage/methylation domain-containing protein [Pelagicoccus enzymogenes]
MTITTDLSRKAKSLRARSGFTLVEVMVGLVLGGLVLAASTGSLLFISRGAAGLGNYHDMNMRSRFMLDKFASDARMTVDVNSASSTAVSLDVYNSTGGLDTIVYSYDPDALLFSRIVYPDQDMAAGVSDVILENVEALTFTYFNMIYDSSTGELEETTNLLEIKEIQLEALMEMSALNTLNTNQIISARYMMRNKKVST